MFDKIEQKELKCISIMTKSNVSEYLSFVEDIYKESGGIPGQRTALKTKTAITIRNRMINDITRGAVLPPIVIGIHVKDEEWDTFSQVSNLDELMTLIGTPTLGRVSIIDGMQRTTAIKDAIEISESVGSGQIRIEYWISNSLNNLIYRMLVLNTGQVPWDISRQLRTIYSPLVEKLFSKVEQPIEIFDKDAESRRRTKAGQYASESIIQMLLSFSSGKYEIDLKDKVADDFARLDLIESSSHESFIDLFSKTLDLLTILDVAFSMYDPDEPEGKSDKRFQRGADVFKAFPAQIGFCVAMSNYLFDEPGFSVDWNVAEEKFTACQTQLLNLIAIFVKFNPEQMADFLDLDSLDELLNKKTSQVGRFERGFFTEAFKKMLHRANDLKTMTPCWRAA